MKRIPHTHPLLLMPLLLMALLFSTATHAEEAVARVLFAHGEVQAYRDGITARNLSRGDTLHTGETVQTGKASSVQFRFTDGALIALRAESDFAIEQHRYNEQTPQQNEQSGQLLRGGLRAITGAIGRERPEAVNVRTPVATIGIRGTVYETFYIPPEGHPALPGVAPGHYLLILRGRVAMINAAGELVLADGEIGYVPDANTPPSLRPDLAGLFARFAALDSEEELVVVQLNGGGSDPDTGDIDNVLTETATGTGTGTVTPGPLAFVVIGNSGDAARFLSQPVVMGDDDGDHYLEQASNGTGDFSEYQATSGFDTGSTSVGNSVIYWGSEFPDVPFTSTDPAHFIAATNVLLSTSDLPTSGTFTYDYVGGSGQLLETSSYLEVNFGNATMSAELAIMSVGVWTASNQSISDFYDSGLSLSGGDGGILVGRFVGSNADGAMGYFSLEDDGLYTGTAAFAR